MGNTLGTFVKLGKLFGFDSVQYQATRKLGGFFDPVTSAKGIGVMTSVKKNGEYAEANKATRAILNTIGKGVLLSNTSGFFPAMGVSLLAGGGIGYLLGNMGSDETTNNNQGLVVEKEQNPKPKNNQAVKIEKRTELKKNYHTINTGGMTWADIVKAYYPKVVENCNGQLYGKDGAIRKLKSQLSECCAGDLINATDIPKTLNLPLELDGIKINDNAEVSHSPIMQKGGHTEIEEAGCKDMV